MSRKQHSRPTNVDYDSFIFDFTPEDIAPFVAPISASSSASEEPGFWDKLGNTGAAILEGLSFLPGGIRDTVKDTMGGFDPNDEEEMRHRAEVDAQQRAYAKKYDGKAFEGVTDAMSSIPYSLATMGSALGAGALAAPAGPVAMGAAGMAASGTTAYRATVAEFERTMYGAAVEALGRKPTDAEWSNISQAFSSQAAQYGLWEAGPEAISNLLMIKILGPLGSRFKGGAKELIKKVAGLYGEELATETVTQMGQGAIEAEVGMRDTAPGPIEAFKEVAPATFWQTTLLGGGKKGLDMAYRRIVGSKNPDSANDAGPLIGDTTFETEQPPALTPILGVEGILTGPEWKAPPLTLEESWNREAANRGWDHFRTDFSQQKAADPFAEGYDEVREWVRAQDSTNLSTALDGGQTVDLLAWGGTEENPLYIMDALPEGKQQPALPMAGVGNALGLPPGTGAIPANTRETGRPSIAPPTDFAHPSLAMEHSARPALPQASIQGLPVGQWAGGRSQLAYGRPMMGVEDALSWRSGNDDGPSGPGGGGGTPAVSGTPPAIPAYGQLTNIISAPRSDTTAPTQSLGLPGPEGVPQQGQVPLVPQSMPSVPTPQAQLPVQAPMPPPLTTAHATPATQQGDGPVQTDGLELLSRAQLLALLPKELHKQARGKTKAVIREMIRSVAQDTSPMEGQLPVQQAAHVVDAMPAAQESSLSAERSVVESEPHIERETQAAKQEEQDGRNVRRRDPQRSDGELPQSEAQERRMQESLDRGVPSELARENRQGHTGSVHQGDLRSLRRERDAGGVEKGQERIHEESRSVVSARKITIKVPGREDVPATYALAEADDVQASHLPHAGFQKNPNYTLQNERRYHDEPGSQAKVLENAARLDPAFLLESVDANHGAPVVDGQGNVLGGNGRAMSIQQAYSAKSERSEAYRAALKGAAERLGLRPADVDGMKRPMLVRRVTEAMSPAESQALVTAMNDSFTDSKARLAAGKSRGDRLSDTSLSMLAELLRGHGTLREAFDDSHSLPLVQQLFDDGVLQKTERNAFVGTDGLLNPDGKLAVEQALAGLYCNDYETAPKLPHAVRGKMDAAVPHMLRAETIEPAWAILKYVREANELLAAYRASGANEPGIFLSQVNMFDGKAPKETVSPQALRIFEAALGDKKGNFVKRFQKWANNAEMSSENTALPGLSQTPAAAFETIFGSTLTVGQKKETPPRKPTEKPKSGPPASESVHDSKIGLKIGETIGGSRADTAASQGKKPKTAKQSVPAWKKRFMVAQPANGNGGWRILHAATGRPVLSQVFTTAEEAEAMLPVVAVGLKHRVRSEDGGTFRIVRMVTDRKRVTIKGGFQTEADAMRYMTQHAQEILETRTGYGEEVLPAPENVYRKGPPRRKGDVKPDDFLSDFGFRGAEFGKWNNQQERQELLNHAYDALMDLAEILNVPPRALSLNGELGIAFGARGQGLVGAKAHYESGYAVINLTKMSGAGSLAHEWLHALDNYLARQDGKTSSEKKTNKRGDMVYPDGSPRQTMASHGFLRHGSGVREAVQKAFESLVRSLYSKSEKYVEDTQRAEKFLGAARDLLREKLNNLRAFLAEERTYGKRFTRAATAEELARFDALADSLVNGEALDVEWRLNRPNANAIAGQTGRYSNDVLDGLSAILKKVRGQSGFTAERHGYLDTIAAALRNLNKRAAILESAKSKDEKVKAVATTYRMDARRIDEGRTTDYWGAEHEMLARAFSAYVEDMAAERGITTDFLVYGANNNMPLFRLVGIRPYPEGRERTDINRAFQKFFETIEAIETDKGVALASLAPGEDNKPVRVVEVDPGIVPEFKKMRDLAHWLKEFFADKRDTTILSTGKTVRFGNTNLEASMKRARTPDHSKAYGGLHDLVRLAEYDAFEATDKRHPNLGGQEIYYSAMRLGGKLYAVKFKFDVPGSSEIAYRKHLDHNESIEDLRYKDHSLREVEVAPILYREPALKGGIHAETGARGLAPVLSAAISMETTQSQPGASAIHNVSLGVLRGAVNASSLKNGLLSSLTPGQHLPPRKEGRGLRAQNVQRVVNGLNARAKAAAPVRVVQGFGELPAHLQKHFAGQENSLEGVFDPRDGTVYLVADNISDTGRAADVWVHEQVVHHGLRSLFSPGELKRVLSRLWLAAGGMGNPAIAGIARRYGLRPTLRAEDRITVMEEYLASLAEKKGAGLLLSAKEKSMWQRLVDAIANAWRALARTVNGGRAVGVGNAEIDALLTSLGRHIMGGAVAQGQSKGHEAFAALGDSSGQAQDAAHVAWEQVQSDTEEWSKQLDAWKAGTLTNRNLTVGATPDVLKKLGAKAKSMLMVPRVLKKIHMDKGIPLEAIRRLPAELNDPLMVFESATMADALVVLTELEHDGENLIAAVHLNVAHGSMLVNEIASVHDRATKDVQGNLIKPGWEWFKTQIENGKLRYYDKNRSSRWFRERSGLQLPRVLNHESYRGIKILTEKSIVKPMRRDEKPLASLKPTTMDRITGADKAMKLVENEHIGSFFSPKGDMSILQRVMMLPHWVAKKFPKFSVVYERQLKRMDECNTDKERSLREVPSLFGEREEVLRGTDMDDLRALIWDNEGKEIPALKNIPKFLDAETLANGRALLKANPEWYAAYDKWLAKQPGSDKAKTAMLEVRRSLDNDHMRAHNRMAAMSELSDGDIAENRTTINHQHNYFPHHRYGQYFVQAKVGDEVVFRIHFDALERSFAKKKAAEIMDAQKENYPGATWTADENRKLPDEVYGAPLSMEAMEQVIKTAASRIGDKEQAEQVRAALHESIADTLKARGWGSHAIGRKGTPGHEQQDIMRVLRDYKVGLAGWLSKLDAARDFSKALGDIDAREHPNEWNYASQYVKDMLRNYDKIDRTVGNIKGVAFAWYLGANLKTAALNLTQNIIVGIPRLQMDTVGSAEYFRAAMAAIVDQTTGRKGTGLTADESKLLRELYDNAIITDGYMEEVRGRVSGVDGAAVWNKLLKGMGWPMAVAERFNRASLALAAYRAARSGNLKKPAQLKYGINGKADYEQAKAYAEIVVRDAHFVYGKANTPEFLRSMSVGRAVSPMYTFRTFSHNLLSLWHWALTTQGKDGAKLVAKSMAATLLIGGVASAPFFGTAMALFQALSDNDDDWLESIRAAATKYLGAGDMTRDILCYGLPSVAGVSFGGSLKMETPFSQGMARGSTPKEVLVESLGDIIGIPYDLFVERPSKVMEAYRHRNTQRIVEEVVPTFMQNILRAHRLHTEGQKSLSGRNINDPGEKGARKISELEAVGKLLGFQPVSATKAYDRYTARRRSDEVRSDKASEFAARMLKAREAGKSSADVRADMQAWNDDMRSSGKPWMVITFKDVQRRVVARRAEKKLTPRERARKQGQVGVWE